MGKSKKPRARLKTALPKLFIVLGLVLAVARLSSSGSVLASEGHKGPAGPGPDEISWPGLASVRLRRLAAWLQA